MNQQQLPIKSPCTQDWNAMEGGGRQRFCRSCDKSVHDLSAMTRAEAQAVLDRRQSGQRLCVRYSLGPAGEILFQRASLLPAGLLVRTRQVALRATLAAAAVVAVAELPACAPAGVVSGAAATRATAEAVVDKLAETGTCSISLEPLLPLSLTFHSAACPPAGPPAVATMTRLGEVPALVEPPPVPIETPPLPHQAEPPPTPASTGESREGLKPGRAAKRAATRRPAKEPLHLMGDIAF